MEQKSRHSRNFLIWLLLLFFVAFFCFVLYDVFFARAIHSTANQEDPSLTPLLSQPMERMEESANLENVTVTVSDYTVYDLPSVDFRFLIAKLKIQAEGPTCISLAHFKTSEGIFLNETEDYRKRLARKSLYPGKTGIRSILSSMEPSYEELVFIPVTGNANTVRVSCDFGNNGDLRFSLIPARGSITDLQYQAEDIISDSNRYQMRVFHARDLSSVPLYIEEMNSRMEYTLPSTMRVLSFPLEAVSMYGEPLTIEEAVYVPSDSSETFTALGAEYQSLRYKNLLNQQIIDHTRGFLFFAVYDPIDAPVSYHGVLKLKCSGEETWITVNAELRREGQP